MLLLLVDDLVEPCTHAVPNGGDFNATVTWRDTRQQLLHQQKAGVLLLAKDIQLDLDALLRTLIGQIGGQRVTNDRPSCRAQLVRVSSEGFVDAGWQVVSASCHAINKAGTRGGQNDQNCDAYPKIIPSKA